MSDWMEDALFGPTGWRTAVAALVIVGMSASILAAIMGLAWLVMWR